MGKVIVQRAMRDADGFCDLAQAERLVAALRHQASGGPQRRLFQIAVAIGRPARFLGHASFIQRRPAERHRLRPRRAVSRGPRHIAG